jgi:hypothetical protein
MTLRWEYLRIGRKVCPIATLSAISPIWTGLESNLGPQNDRLIILPKPWHSQMVQIMYNECTIVWFLNCVKCLLFINEQKVKKNIQTPDSDRL